MGTSTSSAGANSGISFDPPWLNDVENSIDSHFSDILLPPSQALASSNLVASALEAISSNQQTSTVLVTNVAPRSRYGTTRKAMTKFIATGNVSDLKRGLASFIKKGMGGAGKAAQRMRTSAIAASALGGFLIAVRSGSDSDVNAWIESVKQRALSAEDLALEVVHRLVPSGGSIDEESAKNAMNQAIMHLYQDFPEVDIFNLSDDQIVNVMEYTISFDIFNRAQLEVGRTFEKLEHSPKVIQERLNSLFAFIKTVVQESMQEVRSVNSATPIAAISAKTLSLALYVFQEL